MNRFSSLALLTGRFDLSRWPCTIHTARWLIDEKAYDLVVFDWMLPGEDGIFLCRHYRQLGKTSPVLMLTAKDTTADKVTGLDAGTDCKRAKEPFGMAGLTLFYCCEYTSQPFFAPLLAVELTWALGAHLARARCFKLRCPS